jgi:polynucleotide 5'-kinase involved in rRNA processing
MFFTGSLSAMNLGFFQAVLRVLDSLPANSRVVINSNGYCAGESGLVYQQDLVAAFNPEHVFCCVLDARKSIVVNSSQFNIAIERIPDVSGTASQKTKRNLRIAGYFLRGLGCMSEQQPIAIPMRSVRFGVPTDLYFDHYHIMWLFNGALVVLCVDEPWTSPMLVSIVKKVGAVSVKGFGFVKAIDIEKELIFLVTPIDVSGVNLICTSTLEIPSVFYACSPRCGLTFIDP